MKLARYSYEKIITSNDKPNILFGKKFIPDLFFILSLFCECKSLNKQKEENIKTGNEYINGNLSKRKVRTKVSEKKEKLIKNLALVFSNLKFKV